MKDGTKDQILLIDIHDVLTKEGDARGARVRARALTVNRVRLVGISEAAPGRG